MALHTPRTEERPDLFRVLFLAARSEVARLSEICNNYKRFG